MFSACGGKRTGDKLPVLTAYFPVLAEDILGKGGLFVAPPLDDRPTALMGIELEQVIQLYSCRLPSTDLTQAYSGPDKGLEFGHLT